MTNTSRKLFKEFKFKLTNQEIIQKAKLSADLMEQIKTAEEDFAHIKKANTDKIKTLKGQKAHELKLISQGFEDRIVEVLEVRDYAEGIVRSYFNDVLLEERVMTSDERQVEMTLPTKETIVDTAPHLSDISDVIRQETSKRTKLSSVDGPA